MGQTPLVGHRITFLIESRQNSALKWKLAQARASSCSPYAALETSTISLGNFSAAFCPIQVKNKFQHVAFE